jgi:hypothetical protein
MRRMSTTLSTNVVHASRHDGAEPFVRALDAGPMSSVAGTRKRYRDLCQRFPVHCGFPEGWAWHAAKYSIAARAPSFRADPDCMMATIRHDHSVSSRLTRLSKCTPQASAAHAQYENGRPFKLSNAGTLRHYKREIGSTATVSVRHHAQRVLSPAKKYTVPNSKAPKLRRVIRRDSRRRSRSLHIGQIDDWNLRIA